MCFNWRGTIWSVLTWTKRQVPPCHTWSRICLSFRSTWDHLWFLEGFDLLSLWCSMLCFFALLFACLSFLHLSLCMLWRCHFIFNFECFFGIFHLSFQSKGSRKFMKLVNDYWSNYISWHFDLFLILLVGEDALMSEHAYTLSTHLL